MKFVKLTQPNDEFIFVNLENVKEIYYSSRTQKTTLVFDENHSTIVKESVEEIFKHEPNAVF